MDAVGTVVLPRMRTCSTVRPRSAGVEEVATEGGSAPGGRAGGCWAKAAIGAHNPSASTAADILRSAKLRDRFLSTRSCSTESLARADRRPRPRGGVSLAAGGGNAKDVTTY